MTNYTSNDMVIVIIVCVSIISCILFGSGLTWYYKRTGRFCSKQPLNRDDSQ